MRRLPKPVVALVQGRALAGGCGLATGCVYALIALGFVLIIVGLAMGVTMVMLPVGIVIGLLGVAMVVSGVFARITPPA
jgi:enoyl-CoA hydratase/carnithine racemase